MFARMNGVVEIFVGLLLAVAVLALLARKLHIPYPVFFVIGGLLLGWIPGLPPVRLDPELVFLFFLPPLLFPAALFTSWRDLRANLRPITLLAVGLVLFTMVAVAYLAHAFMGLLLVILAAAIGLVYLLTRTLEVTPRYTGLIQAYVLLINEQIMLWTDRIIQPILKTKAWLTLFSKEEK